jgi:hypothetical protein
VIDPFPEKNRAPAAVGFRSMRAPASLGLLGLLAGCNGSATIADGRCPIALAADEQGVYWVNTDGTVMKSDHGTSDPVQLALSANASFIAAAGDQVYFATSDEANDDNTIFGVPRSGGTAKQLVAGAVAVVHLEARSGGVYWCDYDMNLEGIDPDGSNRRLIGAPTIQFTVDDQLAYWIEFASQGAMVATPLSGGTPRRIGQGDIGGDLLLAAAIYGDYVYWEIDSSFSGEADHLAATRIQRAPLGGGATTILHGDWAWPARNSFAVDASGIYWGNTPDAQIMRTSLDGSSTVPIAGTQSAIRGIAVDAANIYWIESGDDCDSSGKVKRIAKPQ